MLTFKQFIAEKFEDAETRKPLSFTGYHYSQNPRFKHDSERDIYVGDDDSWNSDYMGKRAPKKHKIKISLKKPAVYKDDKRPWEGELSKHIPKLKKMGYDGVVYIPKPGNGFNKQALVFGKKKKK
jgi:hypothetical protein